MALLLFLLIPLISPIGGSASEVDQYTSIETPLADATEQFNRWINDSLESAVAKLNRSTHDCSEEFLLSHLIDAMNLSQWDAIEADIKRLHPEIPRVDVEFEKSIYAEADSRQPVLSAGAITHIVSINNIRIGADKLGHFFAQGLILYRAKGKPTVSEKGNIFTFGFYAEKALRGFENAKNAEESANSRLSREAYGYIGGPRYQLEKIDLRKKAAVDALYDEDTIMGMDFNGVRSYADVAANYDGFMFWSQFFGTNVTCTKGKYTKEKDFDWRQWVTSAWDETINCSDFEKNLGKKVAARIKLLESRFKRSLHCPVNRNTCAELMLHYLDVYPYVLSPQCRDFSRMQELINVNQSVNSSQRRRPCP